MPDLNPNALTEIDAVKDELGIDCADTSLNSLIARKINTVSTAAAKYLNRGLLQFQVGIVEKRAGSSRTRIQVTRTPLKTLTSVTILSGLNVSEVVALADIDVEDDGRTGILYLRSGWPRVRGRMSGASQDPLADTDEKNIQITYDGGWVLPDQARQSSGALVRDLPEDIEEAVVSAVVGRMDRRGENRGIKSEKLLSHSVTYEGGSQGSNGFNEFEIGLLRAYRVVAQGGH